MADIIYGGRYRPNSYTLPITVQVEVYNEDIEKILNQAFYNGIGYWCKKVRIMDKLLGKTFSQQLGLNGELIMIDYNGSQHQLTKEKFLSGLSKYLTEAPGPIEGDIINPLDIDEEAADLIVQYALFGRRFYNE